MFKEIIICILILTLIFVGNYITQSYTALSVNIISKELIELKEKIMNNDIENVKIEEKMNQIYRQWKEKHDKLAYYIEHNEIEKLETELESLKSYIEVEQYDEVVNQIERSLFLLNHIKDKYEINLKTIL